MLFSERNNTLPLYIHGRDTALPSFEEDLLALHDVDPPLRSKQALPGNVVDLRGSTYGRNGTDARRCAEAQDELVGLGHAALHPTLVGGYRSRALEGLKPGRTVLHGKEILAHVVALGKRPGHIVPLEQRLVERALGTPIVHRDG